MSILSFLLCYIQWALLFLSPLIVTHTIQKLKIVVTERTNYYEKVSIELHWYLMLVCCQYEHSHSSMVPLKISVTWNNMFFLLCPSHIHKSVFYKLVWTIFTMKDLFINSDHIFFWRKDYSKIAHLAVSTVFSMIIQLSKAALWGKQISKYSIHVELNNDQNPR